MSVCKTHLLIIPLTPKKQRNFLQRLFKCLYMKSVLAICTYIILGGQNVAGNRTVDLSFRWNQYVIVSRGPRCNTGLHSQGLSSLV